MKIRAHVRFATLFTAAIILAGAATGASALPSGGTITIVFGPTDQVVYTPPLVGATLAAEIDAIADLRDSTHIPKDDGKLDNDGDVIFFEQTGGTAVGFNSNKDTIGVRTKKGGVDKGRVGQNQSLQQTLGAHFTGSGLKVVETTLGLAFKQNANIKVIASNSDGEFSPRYIRSGLSVRHLEGHPPPDAIAPGAWDITGDNAFIYNCNAGSDSQPDNDTACLRSIEDLTWTTLKLETFDDPEISADDGGEWSLGSAISTYKLARSDGVLDCFENTITAVDPDSGAVGVMTRLENDDLGVCVPIPYTLTMGGQQIEFLADYQGQNAAFEFNVTWAPEILTVRPALPVLPPLQSTTTFAGIPLSQQQFLSTDPIFYLDLCIGVPNYEELPAPGEDPGIPLGGIISLTPPLAGFPDMSPGLAGTQYGCMLKRAVKYLETDQLPLPTGDGVDDPDYVEITETGYVLGDWRSSRGF